MPTAPDIYVTNHKQWQNRHETFVQDIENLYDLRNGITDDLISGYCEMTKLIQQTISEAMTKRTTLRALGGGWSFTKIATTPGVMLNTKQMNWHFVISQSSVSPQYTGQSQNLLFCQCGNSVQELNIFLEENGRSLKTSGASNGQTIAGALATGTHGSAFNFGSIQEFVVGLHIIVSPVRHIWLERSSYPVASDFFVKKIGAELVRDDELFNAALVSFGSFGFIHGVMIETEPIYLLEAHRTRLPIDSKLQHCMETLDFSDIALPNGNEIPHHFQVVINPYDMNNGAYVTTMYKRPYRTNYPKQVSNGSRFGPGDDAPAFIGVITDVIPSLVSFTVNQLIGTAYTIYSNVIGTHGEIFTNVDTRGKVLSAAVGVPLSEANKVKDILISLNSTKGPFTGVFAFRYVKASPATLAFTSHAPITCVVELDGVSSLNSYNFFSEIWKELDRQRIPYTFHWGKICEITMDRLYAGYGAKVDLWIEARNKLLNPAVLEVFNNPQLKEWGLDKVVLPRVIARAGD